MLIPVLLAGGKGTRLWPLSNAHTPKQFLSLSENGKTFFEQTLERVLWQGNRSLTVTALPYVDRVKQLLPDGEHDILCEPYSRNTAAAIMLAAQHIKETLGNAVMWVVPTDHHITKPEVLREAVKNAIPLAEKGKIVTFGITPTRPDPNYGYIVVEPSRDAAQEVRQFIEKPNNRVLLPLYHAKSCFWNSGMFMMSADTVLAQMQLHNNTIYEGVRKAYAEGHQNNGNFIAESEAYKTIPSLPIDKVIMEQCHNLMVVPVDISWSDIGSWQALWEFTQRGSGDSKECSSCVDYLHRRYELTGE